MSTQDLKNKVMGAVESFINNDLVLLRLKVYEPAVSHRIAFYLERDFFRDGFHVDCEYNKFLDLEKAGPDGKPMRPDIVVHTRNQNANNLIAIEVKKSHTTKRDVEKLKLLTRHSGSYRYDLGVYICFLDGQPVYRWIINGQEKI